MTKHQPAHGPASHLPHLRHHWEEHNRGKDDRWQECRDCGKKRPVPEQVPFNTYLPGPPP
jgi:hypothetical protein